jgi:hypothetical protein
MEKMQKALDELNALITKPSVLALPKAGESLLLYLAMTTQVISATLVVERVEPELPEASESLLLYLEVTTQVIIVALVVEREEPWHVYKVQRPVYYISKVLSDCETRYNQVQKLLYVVLIMKHKLLYYFRRHPVHVVTSHELGEINRNGLSTVRIAKWALELMGLDITYLPQTVIKSHASAEFMVEWTET